MKSAPVCHPVKGGGTISAHTHCELGRAMMTYYGVWEYNQARTSQQKHDLGGKHRHVCEPVATAVAAAGAAAISTHACHVWHYVFVSYTHNNDSGDVDP